MYAAAHAAGFGSVPRTSEAQWSSWVTQVQESQLQAGDLVFSTYPGEVSPGHVSVYVGSGNIIDAATASLGVLEQPLSSQSGHIVGYGRLPGVSASSPGSGSGSNPVSSAVSAVLGIPSEVTKMADQAAEMARLAMWLFNPENWARILAGIFGFFLAGFGLAFLFMAAM